MSGMALFYGVKLAVRPVEVPTVASTTQHSKNQKKINELTLKIC